LAVRQLGSLEFPRNRTRRCPRSAPAWFRRGKRAGAAAPTSPEFGRGMQGGDRAPAAVRSVPLRRAVGDARPRNDPRAALAGAGGAVVGLECGKCSL
jgi:hypothetical protein